MKDIGLYIHIPFCQQKCNYCDFISYNCNQETINKYVSALKKEIIKYGSRVYDKRIKTIFIGGGTPSVLKDYQLDNIIKEVYNNFAISSNIEFSIECNPGTLTKQKLVNYKNYGINRLSIGLQSYDNKLLKNLGRIHTKEDFVENYYLAREVGFTNINIDLIYGLPNQKVSDWHNTLAKVVNLGPEHISAYALKVEEGTNFYSLFLEDKLILPNEEDEREMYHYAIDYLKENGINQYEISNFAKTGYESKHNLIYWKNEEYLGLGVGAHSYLDSVRFSNYSRIDKYIHSLNNDELPIEEKELKDTKDRIVETMFLGLRLSEGINTKEFKKKYNISVYEIYKKKIEKLVNLGLLSIVNDTLKLTRYGMDVSNQVFVEFLLD